MIRFIVPAVPVAQPRPRSIAINGKGRSVPPPKSHPVHAFKATCRLAAQQVYRDAPLCGPLSLKLCFVMPRPKAKQWKTRPMPREPYTASRNDFDNLAKSVTDALTGLVWRDDGQIWQADIVRVIANGNEQPHVEVQITETESE